MSPGGFLALLCVFSVLYVADYSLTLAATQHDGFRELNPLAGYWNTGNHQTALFMKLAGLSIICVLAAWLYRQDAALAHHLMISASLLLLTINAAGIAQL